MIVGIFVLIVLVCLSALLIAKTMSEVKQYDYIGKTADLQNTISVSGEGKVTAAPDVAQVSIGLTTDKATVAEAQKENSTKMNEIVAALKTLGIADKDMQTSDYNIYPKYEWRQSGTSVLVGYTVTQNLAVKIRDTKKISNVLQVAGEKGANQIGSLSFIIDQPDALKDDARAKAIDNAQLKAKALAKQLGVRLGRIVSFNESSQVPSVYKLDYATGMGGGGAAPAPTIQSGENVIDVQVNLVYEIL